VTAEWRGFRLRAQRTAADQRARLPERQMLL
jgi:hypothetical protein